MPQTGVLGAIALAVLVVGGGARAQTPIPPSTKDFVRAASESDQYEILAAQVAVIEGQDSRVRSFAEAMIRDHARLSAAMGQAAAASGLPPAAPGLSGDQARLLGSLQSLRGAEFDRTYVHQQELAHAQALAVEESFAAGGSDANLKKAAQSALPTVRDHLKMAQQLRLDLGGS